VHHGFWQCLDTYKDQLLLEEIWRSGRAPWRGGGMSAGDKGASWWAGRVALVTGCTGFLGCWLSGDSVTEVRGSSACPESVADAHPFELFGLRDRVKVVQGQVEDFGTLARLVAEEHVEVVFHLAGQSLVEEASANPRMAFEVNGQGTWNVFDAVRRAGRRARVVVASSGTVYGIPDEVPCTENTPLRGTGPYDVSKTCAELVARSYHATYAIPVGVVRCGNLYGGGDLHLGRIVPGTIRAVHSGERPVVRSDGRAIRDYLYVEDAARGYMILAEVADRPGIAGETFNLSGEQPARRTRGRRDDRATRPGRTDLAPRVLGESSTENPVRCLSALKARKMLGWSPEVALETGLARTIAWYREAWRAGAPGPVGAVLRRQA
jgi:CDP-glucose 4,6-dehydratase